MMVVDNTVLSNFARVGRLDLLQLAISGLSPHTTSAVSAEFRRGIEIGLFADTEFRWLKIARLTCDEQDWYLEFAQELDSGEATCMAVALSRGWVLATDDLKARRKLHEAGGSVTGTLGILKILVEDESITVSEADSVLEQMIEAGYFSPISRLAEVL